VVRLLIDLRRTVVKRQLARTHPAIMLVTLLLAVLSAVGTLLLGWVQYPRRAAEGDLLALVSALWIWGRVAQSALAGEPILRPEIFSMLPVSRRRIGRALLVVGLLDPANLLLAIALGGLVRYGARFGLIAAVTAVIAVVLSVLLTSAGVTLAAGLLGPGSRRGHDTGTVVTALLISLLAVGGTLLPALMSSLKSGSAPWLSDLVRVLPSGWGAQAVAAAGRSDFDGTVLPLIGLAFLGVLVLMIWPAILGRRMQGCRPVRRADPLIGGCRRLLGSTPITAVAAKELRLWLRDPIRLTCLLIALVVGTATCVLPRVTSGTTLLLPFGGAMTVVIAGACACNWYGNDGRSMWTTVLIPGSARADVRGRQLAWLLAVGPYAVVSTAILTALADRAQDWIWATSLLIALLGGAIGIAAFASTVWALPLDDAGNPTPAWSLEVHLALIVIALTALPPVIMLIIGWDWLALATGALLGVTLPVWLGRLATARLQRRQVDLLAALGGTG
jgi:ABC-2 type transport system permease protein